jgi:plastocyanin
MLVFLLHVSHLRLGAVLNPPMDETTRGPRASTRARAALVSLALALTSVVVISPHADAATTYEVEVGRFFNEADHTKESIRFYPQTLRVHQGDVVHFTTGAFHAVTLLPADVDPDEWVADNAGGAGKRFSMFSEDPDDGAKAMKANVTAMLPSAPCGWPGQTTCSFDGYDGELLHSGVALFPQGTDAESMRLDFSVAINSDPGEFLTVVDVLHPSMRMSIEVVDADEAASDPAAIETANAAAFAADSAAAKKLHKAYSTKKATKKIKGVTYRSVWAGVEKNTVALRGFYPKKVSIKKKQGVRWLFNLNSFSAHTVTFPTGKGAKIAAAFPEIACDPDGDTPEVNQPDTAPASSSFPYCADYSQLELDVPAKMPFASGDGAVKSTKDFESSGVRGAGIAVSNKQYLLRFPKPSTKKGYSYMCMIHEIAHASMRGKVVVGR